MKRRFLSSTGIALLLVFCYSVPADVSAAAGPNEVSARVVAVPDGDTLSVVIGRRKERVRLIGIDAPELGQRPWGANAKKHLRELVAASGMLLFWSSIWRKGINTGDFSLTSGPEAMPS